LYLYIGFGNLFEVTTRNIFAEGDVSAIFILLYILNIALSFFHEIGHKVICKLYGIKTKIGVTHRSYLFLTFECSMNGIVTLSLRKQMACLLGGIAFDGVVLTSMYLLKYFNVMLQFNFIIDIIILLQTSKIFMHLLIAYKTDFYYIFKKILNDRIMHLLNRISYIFIVFVVVMYGLQAIYLFNEMKHSIFGSILFVLILVLPSLLGYYEKRNKS
jgi:hypothetical protein